MKFPQYRGENHMMITEAKRGGAVVFQLSGARPVHEPQSSHRPIEGETDERQFQRERIYRALLRTHGEVGANLLVLHQTALYGAVRYEFRAYFRDPQLIATYRRGEEGDYSQLVEAAWQATPEARAAVLYLPDIDSSQQVLFSMGREPLSARVEAYQIDVAQLRTKQGYRSMAVLPLGVRDNRLGAVVLAWQAAEPLDPFVHLQLLAGITVDLSRVFAEKPHLLATRF